MNSAEQNMVQVFTKAGHRRKAWKRIVSMLACVVVFCTTYALILPAITMEGDFLCGIQEHTHTEACYPMVQTLTCTLNETHTHGDECYAPETVEVAVQVPHTHQDSCKEITYDFTALKCTIPETEGHTHTSSCFGEKKQICTMEESSGHTHTPECGEEKTIICEPESESEHIHDETCYKVSPSCGLQEFQGHSHGDSCYEIPLICGMDEIPAHSHEDGCYAQIITFTCGMDEGSMEEALQTEEKQRLVCTLPESIPHSHTDGCMADGEIVCDFQEIAQHTHTESCYTVKETPPDAPVCGLEAHTHTLICSSDVTADLETREIWEQTFQNVTLSGSPADDLLTIAKTQLGYTESNANYTVLEDGITIRGFTRYGAWAGNPYAAWNQLFAEFCLYYANISPIDVPRPSGNTSWLSILQEAGKAEDATFIPQSGDLMFMKQKSDEDALVGIVSGVNEDGYITVILGDWNNAVSMQTLTPADSSILSYVAVPRQIEKPVPEEAGVLSASLNFSLEIVEDIPQSGMLRMVRSNSVMPLSGNGEPEAQSSDPLDLQPYINSVDVQVKASQWNGQYENLQPGQTVEEGNMLKFFLNYTIPGGKLPESGVVSYQVPVDGTVNSKTGDVLDNAGRTVGTYSISANGLITIRFHETYVNQNRTANYVISGKVAFEALASTLITGDSNKIELDFSNSVKVTIDMEDQTQNDLKVTKKVVSHDPETGLICYQIVVNSVSGTNSAVTLTDTMTNNTVENVNSITVVDKNNNRVSASANPTSGGFTMTLPQMNAGDKYTITYTGKLTSASGNIQARNKAHVSAQNSAGKTMTSESQVSVDFQYNVLDKYGVHNAQDKTVTWTVTVDPTQLSSKDLNGWTLSDLLNGTAYTGSAQITFPNGSKQNVTLPYKFTQSIKQPITVTYTTSDDLAPGQSTVSNKVVLTPANSSTPFEDSTTVDPYPNDWNNYSPVQKGSAGMTEQIDGNYEIFWTLDIDTSKGAVTGEWYISDSLESYNQYFSAEQIATIRKNIADFLRAVYGNNLPEYSLDFSGDMYQNGVKYSPRAFRLTVKADLPRNTRYTLKYSSTALVADASSAQQIKNSVNFNGKSWTSETLNYTPLISKMDGITGSSSDTIHAKMDLPGEALVSWKFQLYLPKDMNTGLTIEEDMPTDICFLPKYDSETIPGLQETVYGLVLKVGNQNYIFESSDGNLTTKVDSHILTASVSSAGDISIQLPSGFVNAYDLQNLVFTVTGKLPDDFVGSEVSSDKSYHYTAYTNRVSVHKPDETTELGSDTHTQKITDQNTLDLITKAYLGGENVSVLKYQFIVNPKAQDLIDATNSENETDWLNVTDTLSYQNADYSNGNYFKATLDLPGVTLTLFDKDGNQVGETIRYGDLSRESAKDHPAYGSGITFSESKTENSNGSAVFEYTMNLRLPDGYKILVEYQYDFDAVGNAKKLDWINNQAKLTELDASDSTDKKWHLTITESDAEANIHGISIYKVDAENHAKFLEGAHYTLYIYDPTLNGGTGGYRFDHEVISNGESQLELTNLKENQAYYLTEFQAPPGYILDQTRHYFMIYNPELKDDSGKTVYIAPYNFPESCRMGDGEFMYIENRQYVDQITVAKRWEDLNGDEYKPSGDAYIKVQLYQVYSDFPPDFEVENIGQIADVTLSVGDNSYVSNHFSSETDSMPQFHVGDIMEITYIMEPEDDLLPGLIRFTDSENIRIPYTAENIDDTKVKYTFQYRIGNIDTALYGWTYEKENGVDVNVRKISDYTAVSFAEQISPYPGGLVTLSSANAWHNTFYSLPAYRLSDAGQIMGYYKYYFSEVESSLDGFMPHYETGFSPSTALNSGKVTITNKPPDMTSITVEKEWLNSDGTTMEPPSDPVEFNLYQVTTEVPDNAAINFASVTMNLGDYSYNGSVMNEAMVVTPGTVFEFSLVTWGNPSLKVNDTQVYPVSQTKVADATQNGWTVTYHRYTYQIVANHSIKIEGYLGCSRGQPGFDQYAGGTITALHEANPNVTGKNLGTFTISGNRQRTYTYHSNGSTHTDIESGSWKTVIENLPSSEQVDGVMKYYTYYVTEVQDGEEYYVTYSRYGTNQYTFCPDIPEGTLYMRNTRLAEERIALTLRKEWADGSGTPLANPPENQVTLQVWQVQYDSSGNLVKEGSLYRSFVLGLSNSWTREITLPAHNTAHTVYYGYYVVEENGTYPVTYQLIDSNGSSTVLSAENAYLLGDGRLDVNHDEKTPAFTAVATNTVVTYVLPNTGGSGTRHYILAGCLLCILTTMCYFLPYTKKQ